MNHKKLQFKYVYARLAPIFLTVAVCFYFFRWKYSSDISDFLDNLLLCHVQIIGAHTAMAFLLAAKHLTNAESIFSDSGEEYDMESDFPPLAVNPETGAIMLDGLGGFDTMGYTFGSGPDDD